VPNILVDTMRRNRAAIKASLDGLIAQTERRSDRNLTPEETRQFDALLADLRSTDSRIVELEADAAREDRAAATRVAAGEGGEQRSGPRWSVGRESATYRPDDTGTSYFRDLVSARRGDYDAAQRLSRNNAEAASESRALGNSGATGGSGGEFAGPAWLMEEFAAIARAGRVTADRLNKQPLPSGVSTINVPKFLTGAATSAQGIQNTAVANTDPTTAAVSSGISTIAGRVVVSQQLIDQGGLNIDQLLLADLAADYARQLDRMVLSGTGSSGQLLGLLNVPGITTATYTQATPSVTGTGGFYAQINKAISQVATTRFLPPTCILMTPSRFSWIAASFDSTGRPLVAPSGNAFNQIADAGALTAEGAAAQVAGLPVFLDANLPQNLGTGANQDVALVLRAPDVQLYESDITLASFDAPYADTMGVLRRAHEYSALLAGRYPSSIAVISGTGMTPPSY
jgi:HK97 family phage major capsid protein